jgi:hypothetical protein
MPDSIRVRWRSAVAGPAFPAHLRVLRGTLLTLVGVMTPDGLIRAARPRLAEVTGLPPRTLDRHLSRGVAAGWLTHQTHGQKYVLPEYRASVPLSAPWEAR